MWECVFSMISHSHFVNMANHMTINMETPRIDSSFSWKEELIELIYINPSIILYLNVNYLDLCHDRVCGHLK